MIKTLARLSVKTLADAERRLEELRQLVNEVSQARFRPLDEMNTFDVDVSTSRTIVKHGLGRAPAGYLVVKRDTDVTVYDEQGDNPRPSDALWLKADKAGKVRIKVW